MRGHVLADFRSSPNVDYQRYRCNNCPEERFQIVNNCNPADPTHWLTNEACHTPGCGGQLQPHGGVIHRRHLSLNAVGVAMGGAWVFTSGDENHWSHEIGHHKHLEHARPWLSAGEYPAKNAPGGQEDQHDTRLNPKVPKKQRHHKPGQPDVKVLKKDRCWDRRCTMSYNKVEDRIWCGKCILKIRGWKVEGLKLPGRRVHD